MILYILSTLFFVTVGSRNVLLTPLKATKTPCCQDTLMPNVCKSMYNRDHEKFSVMCRTNPDFSFIQCCQSCHFNSEIFTSLTYPVPTDLYMHDVANLMQSPNPSCTDRHEGAFCDTFVTRSGGWQSNTVNCATSALAFRVCRKTCGFCSAGGRQPSVIYNSTVARSPKLCQRLS